MSLSRCFLRLRCLLLVGYALSSACYAQDASPPVRQTPTPLIYKVRAANDRIEMAVESSRVLTLDEEIPQVQVGNKDLLTVMPLSANSVQIHAKKPGVTEINLWTKGNQNYAIDVIIHGDSRALTEQIRAVFPRASVKVIPNQSSAILSGYVENPEDVDRIVEIAQEYFPKVLNMMSVAGTQQVLLNVMVAEVNRTGLRDCGFDFGNVSTNSGSFILSNVSGFLRNVSSTAPTITGTPTVAFGIINDSNAFFGVLNLLERKQLMKVRAQPTLQTVSGRPAYFQVGGELPILVPQSLGTVSIDYKKFGTQVDFVPIVQSNGRVRLEIRPSVTELDNTIGVTLNGNTIPGFRSRVIDTSAELSFGETMVLGGLRQQKEDTLKTGIPYLQELPYAGALFSRKTNTINEIELLILCQPELAGALSPEQVPQCLPGDSSSSPSKWDFYARQMIEVPNPNCMGDGCMPDGMQQGPTMIHDDVQPAQPTQAKHATPQTPRVARAPQSKSKSASGPEVIMGEPTNPTSPTPRYIRQDPTAPPAAAGKSSVPQLYGPSGYDVDK